VWVRNSRQRPSRPLRAPQRRHSRDLAQRSPAPLPAAPAPPAFPQAQYPYQPYPQYQPNAAYPPAPGYQRYTPVFVRPEELPYREDSPIPAGYHREERVRNGLVISGAILTAGLTATKTVLVRDDVAPSPRITRIGPTRLAGTGLGLAVGGEL
jgi:hypothetical protein